ncbi:hypothetical protein BDBG_07303 [Blastomyces gilchristii SLH14081]|uniref:Protein kinase domain-containing protein n=1 Tax=Blastomyces gilchristii (strain SLH14081) TaxID=559298 RepID=A0A179UUT1_BLAGS|nr:uncharacterized protein BDBG_07303 [Blastomyces gilchristii SLH14081]OAT11885.1 hypothetical protein BDBG_07303 [Blastomyces gilchristii SLH14081]
MADDEIQRLHQLLENEKRRRQEAEQAQREAEQAQREAEQAQREAEQAQWALEEQIRPLTLFEYLDACHTYLFGGLVPGKPDHSTKGNADNANGKLCPHRIREWLPFADAQTKIWARLLNDENEGFIMQRKFDSLHAIMAMGKKTRKNIHSEIDLRYFQRDAITAPVGSVIEVFFENEQLRQLFGLQGQIIFENHANTLINSENVKIPALIGELKPPHKLPLAIIQNGLQEMELAGIVERHHDETEEVRHRRLVAAVITQAFSYMIKAGVEYRYVSTGEAFIFLHFKADEPGMVYYYLSVPEQDVGKETGFTGEAEDDDNRLHMTAVGQVLAFALRAIRTTPHDQKWKDWAASQLNMWVVTEEDLYFPTPEKDEKPPTPYRPLKSAQIFARNSPVRTRSNAARSTCKPTSLSQKSSGDDSESDPDSPSQRPRRPADVMVVIPPPPSRVSSYKGPVCKDGTRRYCTQKCLLGLLNGGPLDMACPNAKEHGTEVHKIDHPTFLSLLMAQILQEIVDPWTQPLGCESLHRHSARGTEVLKCEVADVQIVSAASEALQAIHALGVLHHDAETRNMFWSVEGQSVLVIDFERAEILRPEREPLGNTSPNQKRKRRVENMGGETKLDVRHKQLDAKFERELKAMVRSLNTYLKS